MIRTVFPAFILLCMLTGCAVSVPPLHQYLLVQPELDKTSLKQGDKVPALAIKRIKVAPFLAGSGIVMQTSTHEINVAGQHRWAAPLERQLRRGLSSVLKKRLGEVAVFHQAPPKNVSRLSVSVYEFQGTHTGNAFVSGTWRLLNADGKIVARHGFRVEESLQADGYDALVRALSRAWQSVSTRIADRIEPLVSDTSR